MRFLNSSVPMLATVAKRSDVDTVKPTPCGALGRQKTIKSEYRLANLMRGVWVEYEDPELLSAVVEASTN